MKITDVWKQGVIGNSNKTSALIETMRSAIDIVEKCYSHYAIATKVPINFTEISILDNAKSVVLLAEKNYCKETYIISRALLEGLITYYYILNSDEETSKNYFHHHLLQKQYRNLERIVVQNKNKEIVIKASNIPELDKNPDLKKSVEKYTSARGRAKTRWTNDNLEKMLSTIRENSKINTDLLEVAVNVIYSEASEALHGTSYGCVFPFGLRTPNSILNPLTVKKEFHESLRIALFITSELLIWHVKNIIESLLDFEQSEFSEEFFEISRDLESQTNVIKIKLEGYYKQ